ncbi:MAG: hypothetical protein BWY76_02244 [bacterium ADurb.Bin429]|nr:MAG: hypothetical protein BWY76_02244 [bacterium ADurb.Bin429]
MLTQRRPAFRLLETLLWRPGRGYYLRHGHLRRLRHSAEYFDFAVDMDAIRAALEEHAADWGCGNEAELNRLLIHPLLPELGEGQGMRACAGARNHNPHNPSSHVSNYRVRLLVSADGAIEIQATPLPKVDKRPWRVALAPEPIDPADPFLYHKTTHRAVYETAHATHPDADDVLLWNPRGELTEATIANLAVRIEDRWLTPPIACGLLPGVMRAHLLRHGVLTEAVITRDMLAAAEEIALINSVRGWLPAELLHDT